MAMVDKIACFLTCGYTEAGAMQFFLKKIDSRYEYKQYLPNKTVKKKGYDKSISSKISGLTGEALLKKVYNILEKHKDEISKCKAVLIEDDLDGKFYGKSEEEIELYKNEIVKNVHERLKKDIPVFILYASPEVESWFIADWERGFQYLYCDSGIVTDMDNNAKRFFCYHLKKYIDSEILGDYVENIEDYGWIEGKYIKLSDKLIETIQEKVKDYIGEIKKTNAEYVKQISESRDLYYSKKVHGDRMLRNIDPGTVALKCRRYFFQTYNQIIDMQ